MTRRLTRSPDRMVGGVCSGIADYAGLDVTLVRLIVVLGTIFGLGSFLLIYLIGWVLIPSE